MNVISLPEQAHWQASILDSAAYRKKHAARLLETQASDKYVDA